MTWIVDPLDGTSNYAHGIPFFCVSVAVRQTGGPLLAGVVYDPLRDECFAAERGRPTAMAVSTTDGARPRRRRHGDPERRPGGDRRLRPPDVSRCTAPAAASGCWGHPPSPWRTSPAGGWTAWRSATPCGPGTSPPASCWSKRPVAGSPASTAGRRRWRAAPTSWSATASSTTPCWQPPEHRLTARHLVRALVRGGLLVVGHRGVVVDGVEHVGGGRWPGSSVVPLVRAAATARNGSSRSVCGSRGRPSTRSARMVFWISSVPPAIDWAGTDTRTSAATAPDARPARRPLR